MTSDLGTRAHMSTSTDLLAGLRDPRNRTVWNDYVDRYRPMIVRYGRRLGLDATDAEDVAQQTLVAFSEAYRAGKYERDRGRLRSWLFGIAHGQLRSWRRNAARREIPLDGEIAEALQGDARDELEERWEKEWRDAVLAACLDRVRSEVTARTFEAFQRFATDGWPAARVAEHLGITENAVFGAKRRVLRRLRELLPEIEETW